MKKSLLYIVITVVVSMATTTLFAQRDMMLSQQFFSRLNINPSATGNTDDVDIFLLGRWQWMGLENSPKSGVLNVTNYFENIRSGVGLSATYDDVGIANRTLNIKAAYAYHLNLNESILMSFGLSAGMLYHYFDPTKNIWLDPAELETETLDGKETKVKPDMDFGVELAMPKFMVGASVVHLLSNEKFVGTAMPGRQFNFYARALFSFSESFDLAPAICYTHRNTSNRIELNVMGFIKRFIWAGVTYRPDINGEDFFSSNMLHFNVGIEYKFFRIGYAFELGLGDVSSISNNSSEILLSFKIAKKKNKAVRFLED